MAKGDGKAHLKKMELTEQVLMSDFSLATLTVHFSFNKKSKCKHLFEPFNDSLSKHTSPKQLRELVQEATKYYFKISQ